MTFKVYTPNPQRLIDEISAAIENNSTRTWSVFDDAAVGICFRHTPEQWSNKGVIWPNIILTSVRTYISLEIRHFINYGPLSEDEKGYLLGRFSEQLMANFRQFYLSFEFIP